METPFSVLKVLGEKAIEELQRLRREWRSSTLYPFIIGTDDEMSRLEQSIEPPSDGGESILRRGLEFDIESWLRDNRSKKRASWPKQPSAPHGGILSLTDPLTRARKGEINIGLIQVTSDWQIFARLGFGGWNDCPPPHIHVALHRYWDIKHKTSLLCLGGDVVESLVRVPPADQGQAMDLAHQQHSYCYDIVEQGVGTIGKLASSLLNGRYWYFWWD